MESTDRWKQSFKLNTIFLKWRVILHCQFALNTVLSSILIALSQDLWYEKERKISKSSPWTGFQPGAPTLKELFFIALIAKDQLTRKCAHYLPNQIIYI